MTIMFFDTTTRSLREPGDPDPELDPIEWIPDDVRDCPQCTYDEASGHPGTFGCSACRGTGMRDSFAFRGRLAGGHYHVAVWVGVEGQRANAGTIILDPQEFAALKCATARNPLAEVIDITETP